MKYFISNNTGKRLDEKKISSDNKIQLSIWGEYMLSSQQLAQYDQDGCLLVSGLIPEDTLANAEATVWSVLGMDRNDPTS